MYVGVIFVPKIVALVNKNCSLLNIETLCLNMNFIKVGYHGSMLNQIFICEKHAECFHAICVMVNITDGEYYCTV